MLSKTPEKLLPPVWPLSLSLATTQKISVDFFSSPYLDVSVQAVPLTQLWIHCVMHDLSSCGLLHSDICGSMRAYHSPQLFAVNHVLHRLLMPRHSPCALSHFTYRSMSSRSLKTVVSRLSLSFSLRSVALLIVSFLLLFLYSVFKLLCSCSSQKQV